MPPSRRLRYVLYGALGILVAAGAAASIRARSSGSTTRPTVTRDVPQMDHGVIAFSPAFRERAGIAFTKVERAPFRPTVRVVGTVAFNPSYMAAIGTRLRGTVRRTFKYEGDRVKVGEALAEVESAELGEAQAGIAQADATLKAAEVQARREGALLDKGLTTAREAEMAETDLAVRRSSLQAAEQRVKAFGGGAGFGVYVLKSPIAGHVVERKLSPGQSVDGTGLGYRIADLTHLWIELSVFERDLGAVHVDDDVEVSPLADPTLKLPGKVAHVGQVIDPVSRSTDVRVTVDDPLVRVRPGQSVEAVITSGTAPREAVLVPHDAIVYVDGKATVFVADDETHVRAVTVQLGASDGKRHEVTAGLEPGRLVASSGVFALKSELYR
jgi:membrane fusion protein, heavy metal efflux system